MDMHELNVLWWMWLWTYEKDRINKNSGPAATNPFKTFKELKKEKKPVLRIRDVYPGSWFLPIPNPGSKNSNKREGRKQIFLSNLFL